MNHSREQCEFFFPADLHCDEYWPKELGKAKDLLSVGVTEFLSSYHLIRRLSSPTLVAC